MPPTGNSGCCVAKTRLEGVTQVLFCLYAVLSKDEWVRGSFLRDQDVTVDVSSLEDVFQRILSLNGSSEAFVNATLARPDFAILHQ